MRLGNAGYSQDLAEDLSSRPMSTGPGASIVMSVPHQSLSRKFRPALLTGSTVRSQLLSVTLTPTPLGTRTPVAAIETARPKNGLTTAAPPALPSSGPELPRLFASPTAEPSSPSLS